MSDQTQELMLALLTASGDKKERALQVLRGEGSTSSNTEPERFLTARELGRTLNFSVQSIWRWQPPAHQLGGKKRYILSEVRSFLDSPEFAAVADKLRRERRAAYRASKKAS